MLRLQNFPLPCKVLFTGLCYALAFYVINFAMRRKLASHDSILNLPQGPVPKTCVNSKGEEIQQANVADLGKVSVDDIPVHVYLHTALSGETDPTAKGNFRAVLLDILTACEQSGVYHTSTTFTLNVVGSEETVTAANALIHETGDRFTKVNILNLHADPLTFEFTSINDLIQRAKEVTRNDAEAHFLYIHTKGLYSSGDGVAKWHWRKFMEYWTLHRHRDARALLASGYDALGSNAINFTAGQEVDERIRVNPEHGWHYSGNFWWASAQHLSRQRELKIEGAIIDHWSRCLAEFTVLSNIPNMCAGELYHHSSSHMYSLPELPNLWNVVNTPTGTELIPQGLSIPF